MKAGYLYVLIHPSKPNLYKVGRTTTHPNDRLGQHNGDFQKYAGQIVKETGQKWELKTFIPVPDPTWAESIFWQALPLTLRRGFQNGIEIQTMEWDWVQEGLNAARKAGVRLPPKPVPDYVYEYTAWMKKRLQDRDLTLIGLVKSKSGKSSFKCCNDHEWRALSRKVAEGEGCPTCGIGKRDPVDIWQSIKSGILCLLTHPGKPGLIKIELTYRTLEQCIAEGFLDGWIIHRYRSVFETALAKTLIWEILDHRPCDNGESLEMDIGKAEQAFRDLSIRLRYEIALQEKANG